MPASLVTHLITSVITDHLELGSQTGTYWQCCETSNSQWTYMH